MKVRPLGERVVMKAIPQEETTKGGIVLPGTAQETPEIAEIIEVGDGVLADGKTVEMQVKPGDRVIYARYAATDVKVDGEDIMVIRQSEILAVIEK